MHDYYRFKLRGLDKQITNFLSFCSYPVYVGTVIGATCNCNPVGGESTIGDVNCQDYQLQEETTVVNAQVVARGVCSNEETPYLSESYHNCTAIGTSVGVVSSGNCFILTIGT